MGWFSKRREEKQASLVGTMAAAFAQALSGVLQAQSAQIKQSSEFLGTLQDLSARKAAQVLGSKGGRTTQRRKKEAKAAAAGRRECVLCDNPMHRGTTLEQITFHRLHEGAEQAPPPDLAREAEEEQGRGN